MLAHALVFYLFSFITIASSLAVISARNTIHAVFFLILDFVSVSCLFIMMGAEYLGMLTLIVYVGAVAVLFLFVVMMLNVNFKELKSGFLGYVPFGAFIGIVLLIEIGIMLGTWRYKDKFIKTSEIEIDNDFSNTEAIGNVLYTDYLHYFQISGLILLVAMIGAILLTFRRKDNLKRQDITKQVSRERADGVLLSEIESFKGVKLND
ncbi:MAG: NADH:ubiquinone oxidoreductase subunit J [Candidatus Pelagibacter sp.]|nr:NADH:ubiquinone oxidoreductase subunit J [Candidatus Pelagibacter sp.]OUV87316.1 MAG: NADH:ubiquinone oxidoreductase subunit J [Pelagibacteraceae bacterium TMED136]|tara:strand:+ start:18610 stop:19230 length:621 start_codon:yes stop_codon:yes gene_type:complete